ncbi:helix-turn-helix domain-containing protein [Eubacteriaceae bacterium ES2]|nr:helix-turn-helix domain-containing protein [Eubacteriaceae bacterium ES2]
MELALCILMDELASFKPVIIKALSDKKEFAQVRLISNDCSESNEGTLYIIEADDLRCHTNKLPANLILIGNECTSLKLEKFNTLIQISEDIELEAVIQKIFDIFTSYNQWDQRLLTAIIEHVAIDDFLNIAIEKLLNPIALFDNGLTVIASAGNFERSPKGTIWEKINLPGYPLVDFFTLQEQTELSLKTMKQIDAPYLHQPVLDLVHTYASTHIWIDGKLCGNIGLVDINTPFTSGQLRIIWHITLRLTQYFKTNEIYLSLAENQTGLIKHLIEDSVIQDKNIAYHLNRYSWDITDDFYLLTFIASVDAISIIEANAYIKRIYNHYPNAMVTVYENDIILVIRKNDYLIEAETEQKRLKILLDKYEMKCGISNCFQDFLQLRLFYIQSSFAAKICAQDSDVSFCFYGHHVTEHLLECLEGNVDPRVFCHPKILEIQKSNDEQEKELLRNLRIYLLFGRNLSSAAKALNLHRNTLIYRIDKISRRFDLDFNTLDETEIFSLIFSCIIAENLEARA